MMSLENRLANGIKVLTRATARKFLFLGDGSAPAPCSGAVAEPIVNEAASNKDARMIVIGVLNAKGGSGKSTTAINLSVAARYSGERAGIVDLDWEQHTSHDWGAVRNAAPYVRKRKASDLRQTIEDARSKGYTFLIVDTPGQDTAAATAVIRHVDFILVPSQPTWMDITPTKRLLSRLADANVRHAVVLTRVHDGRRTRNSKYREALARYARVLNETVPARESFGDAAGNGLSIFEIAVDGAGEAAERILRLYDEICDLLQEP